MRRAYIDTLFRYGVYPSVETATAWEDKRVHLARGIDHRKLKIPTKGRGCDGLPHCASNAPIAGKGFDLRQLRLQSVGALTHQARSAGCHSKFRSSQVSLLLDETTVGTVHYDIAALAGGEQGGRPQWRTSSSANAS